MKTLLLGIGVLVLSLAGTGLWAQDDRNPVAPAGPAERSLARDLLRELVEINTAPASGSTKAAEAMAARLRSAGFAESDVLLLGPRPDRQNLVIRLRGSGKAKPILLIAHLDVVDAPREGWSAGLDPFRLTERDGFFYGRGVLDDKSAVACLVANLIRLGTEGFTSDRDIVVALTADEESGSANGIGWLLEERHDLMDVAYCLNLDAAKRIADASPYHNAVLRTTCVVTRMDAGHADNALPQSARAIINCRVFPGDSLEFVRDSLIKALDDPEIQLTPLGSGQPSPVSPLLPEVMGAIERLSHEKWPSIPVLPVMDPWASDSARLRRAGIPTFGASGTFGEMDFGNAHGANERLPVDAFYDGVEFLNRLLRSMTGPFDSESPGGIHTGFTVGGIGWYRKHFALPRAWRDKVVTVRFDGAYMNADVWINGQQDKPEARQLLSSLLRYMNSDEFNPATVLDENTIQDILR